MSQTTLCLISNRWTPIPVLQTQDKTSYTGPKDLGKRHSNHGLGSCFFENGWDGLENCQVHCEPTIKCEQPWGTYYKYIIKKTLQISYIIYVLTVQLQKLFIPRL